MAATRKRKATEQTWSDPYDSDEIQVTSTQSARSALSNVPVPRAQNKRRRVLDCVLIPNSRESRKLLSDQQTSTARARRQHATLSETPSNSEDIILHAEASSTALSRHPSPHQQTKRHPAAITKHDGLSPEVSAGHGPSRDTSSGRPRRSGQRVSYATMVELADHSADELSTPGPRPTKKRKATKKPAFASSDYEDDARPGAVESEEEYQSEASSNASSVSSVDQMTDEEEKAAPRRKPAAASRSASNSIPAGEKKKPTAKGMKNLTGRPKEIGTGLDLSLPPLHRIDEIFADLTKRALDLGPSKALDHLAHRPLRLATMCSGTESPFLALQLVQDALQAASMPALPVEHLFSAEIVQYKQGYIERNFKPPIIFRDVTELMDVVNDPNPMATTAYGSKVAVPSNIDLLVVGSSCVDFSNLNKHKKEMSEGGESGLTWNSVLAYCKSLRPLIFILENVQGAPWDDMLSDFRQARYIAEGVQVDTKNHYIPQTRRRGYMVCYDRARARSSGAEGAGTEWQDLMEKFKRNASSPVSSFLLPSDQVTVPLPELDDNNNVNKRNVDWEQCKVTQLRYRANEHLGFARPMTHWSESGAILPPEHGSHHWHKMQVERVLDTTDAAALRKAREGYDVRFKSRIWDLSQNIYMNKDTSQFGIVGCLTPSGQNFISDEWRAMMPEELLQLQGIPLNKISFTVETPSEVRDLAGNAMTTTVVGAAMLSSLIAGHALFDTGHTGESAPVSQPRSSSERMLQPSTQASTFAAASGLEDIDTSSLIRIANTALRRCYCEGDGGLTANPLQKCTDCGHTTCISCGGNPTHKYMQSSRLNTGRIPLYDLEAYLRSRLPLRLKLHDLPDLALRYKNSWSSGLSNYIRAIKDAAGSRDISGLYVEAPKDLAANAWLRETLSRPVAKSQLQKSLLGGMWLWRKPDSGWTELKLIGSGRQMPTWRARMQMPNYVEEWQWEFLEIQVSGSEHQLSGLYKYLPDCGTACESLYKKIDQAGTSRPIYLFLDPTRAGNADQDCFVFAYDHSRLEKDELRHALAYVDSSWKPWGHDKAENSAMNTRLKHMLWQEIGGEHRLEAVPTTCDVTILADRSAAATGMGCRDAVELASANVKDLLQSQSTGKKEGYVELNDTGFFSETAWVFEAMRRKLFGDEWILLKDFEAVPSCTNCAPDKPMLRWMRSEDEKTIEPYEDLRGAAVYERAMKTRNAPIIIKYDGRTLSLGVNLQTLAHRARSRLPASEGSTAFYWRLVTSISNDQTTRRFKLSKTVDVGSKVGDLEMQVPLFPTQELAVAWMQGQEDGKGRPFLLEEAVESDITSLGWRVELRATSERFFKGGICADQPGFGKSITTLALVQTQWLHLGVSGIQKQLEDSHGAHHRGLYTSAATVVICPRSLLQQWVKETREKLQDPGKIITIAGAADLLKHSINDFRSAKLIFLSRSTLVSEGYVDRLAAFAAMPGPVKDSGRAYSNWHMTATTQIPEHVKILRDHGRPKLVKELQTKYAHNIESEEFNRYTPSRRLKGRAIGEEAQRMKAKANAKAFPAAPPSLDTHLIGPPLFEMFFFNRIVVDEFHLHRDTKELAATAALHADKKWCLSGTPALDDCYDVSQMAKLLGCPLRIGSVARESMKKNDISALRKDMTPFELFDQRRAVPSRHQQARIHEVAQSFLDTFVRRNVMDFAELVVHQHLIPVHLDLAHHAMYHELSQHLNSLDMTIKKGSKSKTTDREEHFFDAAEGSRTAEEALSKAAAFPRRFADTPVSGQTYLTMWTQQREAEIDALESRLGPAIRDAYAAEGQEYGSWKSSTLDRNRLEDEALTATIRRSCQENEGKQKGKVTAAALTKGKGAKGGGQSAKDKVGIREKTSELNNLVTRLLVSTRSLRYLKNVRRMSDHVSGTKKNKQTQCDSPTCKWNLRQDDRIAVSGHCGHTVCKDCFTNRPQNKYGKCVANGCLAQLDSHHCLWSHALGDLGDQSQGAYGAKIEAALEILEDVREKGEQAVLFVQYANQMDEIEQALTERGIAAEVVKGSLAAGGQVERFCEEKESTVIVLNASEETAAGLNIQEANHVIFLSPLLRDTQYAYESTMAQAIGRVRRHGQKNKIHVYRIVALNTIDVDILEHRERRTDAITEQGAPAIAPPPAAKMLDMHASEPQAERTQLVRDEPTGKFSLRPQSWLVRCGAEDDEQGSQDGEAPEEVWRRVKGRRRVGGWEDFSSLVKFSRGFTEDDE